jgi:hypothetical protein
MISAIIMVAIAAITTIVLGLLNLRDARTSKTLALADFLDVAEKSGCPINTIPFKASALNRANLLRIKQLEDQVAAHEAVKLHLVKQLESFISVPLDGGYRCDKAGRTYGSYVNNYDRGSGIASCKNQLRIEQEYSDWMAKRLANIKAYHA